MSPAHIKGYALAALILFGMYCGMRWAPVFTPKAVAADCSLRGAL